MLVAFKLADIALHDSEHGRGRIDERASDAPYSPAIDGGGVSAVHHHERDRHALGAGQGELASEIFRTLFSIDFLIRVDQADPAGADVLHFEGHFGVAVAARDPQGAARRHDAVMLAAL